MSEHDDQPTLARNLEEASMRQLVHVDNRGRTRSPARYRAITAASYTAIGVLVAGAGAMWASTFGLLPGLAVGGAFAAWCGWILRPTFLVRRGTRLLLDERYDEAIALMTRARRGFAVPRQARALAEQNLGIAYAWQGDFERALTHQRAALRLHRGRRRGLYARMAAYSAITTLVNLDRVADARGELAALPAPDADSDYLQVLHWSADLYVCMAEGRHELAADALHERALTALKITNAAALLGLVAWAHHHVGDLDQAFHLLREAYAREWSPGLQRGMPRLYSWMEEQRAQAAVDNDPVLP